MHEKTAKNLKTFASILILSALLIGTIGPNIASVKAQAQATVIAMAAVGGTTDPTGTTTYADGTSVTLTGTPGDGFVFANWNIVTIAGGYEDLNNPTTLVVNATIGTYVIQAVFEPVQFVTPATVNTSSTNAIVVVLAGVGGTTSPAPGTYALANAASLDLTATASSGFVFHNWIIGGSPMNGHGGYSFTDTPTANPYNVNHGYGNTYTYQPVFVPTGSSVTTTGSTPTPSPSSMSTDAWIIIVALVVIIVIVVIALVFVYTKRSKKEVK